jgi:shikimate kinase
MKNIVFIGMPGAGKTTVGKAVAEALHRPFVDSDRYLEKKIGRDIKELFRESEELFRQEETEVLRELSSRSGIVLSCGGGVVKRPENIPILKENGIIVFLDRPVDSIAGSIDAKGRPLLSSSANRLQELYEERYGLYVKYSDILIPVMAGIPETVRTVLEILERRQ